MALFDVSRPVVANHTIGARISNLIPSITGSIKDWNDARATRNTLSKLSDHELEDIGITRGDIDRIM